MINFDLREGQQEVRGHLASADIAAHITEMGELSLLDPDQLKRAHIALLVAPTTRALDKYLMTSRAPSGKLSPSELIESVSATLSGMTLQELVNDPHYPLMKELEKARNPLVFNTAEYDKDDYYREKMSIVVGSAVSALYSSAAAAAMTITGQLGDIRRQEFTASVARSLQLPTQWLQIPLEWHNSVVENIDRYYTRQEEGRPLEEELLRYDLSRRAVVLNKPIAQWPRIDEDDMLGGLIYEAGPTGCPISFDMKLAAGFYEYMVRLIEARQAWPESLQDSRLKNLGHNALEDQTD